MTNHPSKPKKEAAQFALQGISLGVAILFCAILIELNNLGLNFSVSSIITIHQENPLMWLMDAMPIIIPILSVVHRRGLSLIAQAKDLKKEVAERSQKINEQKIFYESLVNNSPVAIVTMDAYQKIISINDAFSNLFQYTEEEIKYKSLDDIIARDEDVVQAYKFTSQVLEGGKIHGIGKRQRKDGSLVDVEIYGVPILVDQKRIGVLGMYIDITDRIKAEETIKKSELRFRSLFHDSPISMWEFDFSNLKNYLENLAFSSPDELKIFLEKLSTLEKEFPTLITVLDANQATLLLFKAADLHQLKKEFDDIFIDQSVSAIQHIIISLYSGSRQIETEFTFRTLDNILIHTIVRLSLVAGNENNWARVYVSIIDITERKWTEERLRYLSMRDSMTCLFNRAFFESELTRLSQAQVFPISIIIGDLDNLKRVNDTYGHNAGDALICKTASLFIESFRSEDIIARLGGDEFAVIIPHLEESVVQKILARLRKKIDEYNTTQENPGMRINISLGTATAESNFETEELFKLADQRMYQEKNGKRK
ncbi:MAG TPA: hypothetical protein DCK95_08980 [Anaerolineaceae bacterium]|nr:hypothetical protein [Anaerolineaceae bacterium]